MEAKAKALVDKMGVEHALICVDEIIKYHNELSLSYHELYNENEPNYWKEVKKQIELL